MGEKPKNLFKGKIMKLFLSLTFLLSSLSFASTEASYEANGFEHVVKASKRSDGNYNVICENGSVEINVTLEDLLGDKVCVPAEE